MDEILQKVISALDEGEDEKINLLVQQALDNGFEPMTILENALMPAMTRVGEKFACGEYFLPNLIVSAEAMKQAMSVLEPAMRQRQQMLKRAGVAVIGTVQGDIHEIGKTLVGTMLSVNGFEVHDLGVDVTPEKFVSAVAETGANLLGLSALLTTTMTVQRDVIQKLEDAGIREQVKVIVGGAPVTRAWADEIGADGYAEDAIGAVEIARRLLDVEGTI
ncbi:MAG: corrinoid protein [Anaerolineales bacterium]|jgi:corrinoid protein of di/trimethylamine methyltransferase